MDRIWAAQVLKIHLPPVNVEDNFIKTPILDGLFSTKSAFPANQKPSFFVSKPFKEGGLMLNSQPHGY